MAKPRRDLPQIPQLAVAGPNKVLIFHKETGEAFERWPIDAREMLAQGSYQMHPPGEEAPEPEYEEQQEHVKQAEALAEANPIDQERATRQAADEAAAKVAEAKPAGPPPPKEPAAKKKPGPKKGQGRTSRATSKKGKGKGK
jgi:hypothetical protein